MAVLNIAMVGTDALARDVAKPSDQRDVHTYVHKETSSDGSQRILSLIRPARFPERIRPLLSALGVSRAGFLEIHGVDATLGEALIAFSSSGIQHGVYTINPPEGEWVDEDQVKALIQQAGLSSWKYCQPDGIEIRSHLQEILEEMLDVLEKEAKDELMIPVDQHFNVKGIGLVAIGYVQQGSISIHDEIMILPSEGIATARSLQVMDDDVPTARAGDRVGLAMRNAQEDWLSNGAIIIKRPSAEKKGEEAPPIPMIETSRSKITLERSPFNSKGLDTGDVVHISSDLQFLVGRVEEAEGDLLTIAWDSPLLIRREGVGVALLNQLDSTPRILGRVTTIVDLETAH